ncbi:AAA family ATPase [Pleomorphovibrio marinus]|uniref:AAA family ATPase n=1 Tax=Pleomorphovibrio marinus TaxID=2164132 RepID=UPI000E0B7586
MHIHRHLLDRIEKQLFKGKVILLYGARRTGKTTLVKRLLSQVTVRSGYFNCELQHIPNIGFIGKTSVLPNGLNSMKIGGDL